MAKVKIRRDRVKKGILTEVEITGVVFDGLESDDVALFYIKQISRAYADTIQAKLKDTTPENFLAFVEEIIVEILVDDEGHAVFDDVNEIPYTFTLAAWRPVLKAAFDIEFGPVDKIAETDIVTDIATTEAAGVEELQVSTMDHPSTPDNYGPNGADSTPTGDLSPNPFTQTQEGDSSTG